jgi:hypothetical protein
MFEKREPYTVYEEEKAIFIQDYAGLAELHNKYNLFTNPEVIDILQFNNNLYDMIKNKAFDANSPQITNSIQSLIQNQEKMSRMIGSDYYIRLIQTTIIKSNLPIEFNGKNIYLLHGGKQYSL